MYGLASRLAVLVAGGADIAEEKVDTIRFGLEIILGEIIKFAIIITLAIALGILPEVLFAMVTVGVLKAVTGGAHCSDYWRCLVFGIIVFIGSGLIGVFASRYFLAIPLAFVVWPVAFIAVVMVIMWAPGEVPFKKEKPGERVFFKALGIVFLLIWTFSTVFLIIPGSVPVALAGLICLGVQVLCFTPRGYRVIDTIDKFLSRILGERRCSASA